MLAWPDNVRDVADSTTPHISVSQASMVETCPLKWRYRYVEGLPVPPREDGDNWLLGNAIDRALATIYAYPDSGDAYRMHIDQLPTALRTKADYALDLWRGSRFADLDAAAVQRRHRFVMHPPGCGPDGLAVIGYSDLIATDGTLVDWKYGGKPNDPAWVRNASRQLRYYAYAETELTVAPTAYIVRFGGRELTTIPVDLFDAGGMADLIEWLYACAERGPGATEHAPTPGAHCGWCPYTAACAAQTARWARRHGNG